MRRHSFDAFSFVLGVLFAAVGVAFLFGNADVADLHLAVVWPLPLILIGVLMLVSTLQRRNRPELQPAPAPGAPVAIDPATERMASAPVATGRHRANAARDDGLDGGADDAEGIEPAPDAAGIDGLDGDDQPGDEEDETRSDDDLLR